MNRRVTGEGFIDKRQSEIGHLSQVLEFVGHKFIQN